MRHPLLVATPNPSIQRGNLSDMDWTERQSRRNSFDCPQSQVIDRPSRLVQTVPEGTPSLLSSSRSIATTAIITPRVAAAAVAPIPPQATPTETDSSSSRNSSEYGPREDLAAATVRGSRSHSQPWYRRPIQLHSNTNEALLSLDSQTVARTRAGLPCDASRLPSLRSLRDDVAALALTQDPFDDSAAEKEYLHLNAGDDHEHPHLDGFQQLPSAGNSTSTFRAQDFGRSPPEEIKPLPASKVFSRKSLPLHLAALDAHLSDPALFSWASFTPPDIVCSETEKQLFRYQGRDDWRSQHKGHNLSETEKLQAAGRQLRLPRDDCDPQIRQRKKKNRKGLEQGADFDLERAGDIDLGNAFSNLSKRQEAIGVNTHSHPPAPESPGAAPWPQFPSWGDSSVDSALSSDSRPQKRAKMFPPLMLLRTNALRELKSNAVGPRAPKTGILGMVPGLQAVVGSVLDTLLGVEGSSLAVNLFRLELLRDFAQIMRANLTFREQLDHTSSKTQKFFAHTLPAFLALDFVSIFGLAIMWLLMWMAITAGGLFWFWKISSSYDPNRDIQGYEGQPYIFKSAKRGSKALNIFITFVLTTLYMPLSKLALDTVFWSKDYWQVPDPYQGGTIKNPAPPPLGNPMTFRDPLDFCYTTTMRKDEFNFAWIIVPAAGVTLLVYTLLWPIYMAKVIRDLRPRVSPFNELGVKRSKIEMDREYERQLGNDKAPLNYLYMGFNRLFSSYKPFHLMFFRLSTLFLLSFLGENNCLWKKQSDAKMVAIQQGCLIGLQVILLVVHIFTRPFVDVISNRSELVGRATYVLTAVIGLLAALHVHGANIYESVILWIVQGFSYSSSIYFSIVSTNIVAHKIKRLQKRIDFSLDIYSPNLDLEKHVKRRVWQETLSIILLSGKEYRMPIESVITFSASDTWPPYLLFFKNTPAERHIENLMILKAIGMDEYQAQLRAMATEHGQRLQEVMARIQEFHAGPDAYFRPIHGPFANNVTSFFGKAFVVPFPPTLVIRYDQQQHESITLTTLAEFELFVQQNESLEVQHKKEVRIRLRALDGQTIRCSYRLEKGRSFEDRPANLFPTLKTKRPKTFTLPIIYNEGKLSIRIKDFLSWDEYNFASGFEVFVKFSNGQRLDPEGATWVTHRVKVPAAEVFGLQDAFIMTPELGQLFYYNDHILQSRLPEMRDLLKRYRHHFFHEAQRKREIMKYSFLCDVFDNSHLPPTSINSAFKASSSIPSVQDLPSRYPSCISSLYERLAHIRKSPAHTYWYLFWDDFYRQNGQDYKVLRCDERHNAKYFDPKFPTSIAYQPMPRSDLETFLKHRGAWKQGGRKGVIHNGLLNRLYFCLNRIVFAPVPSGEQPPESGWTWTPNEIPVGLSNSAHPKKVKDIKPYHPFQPSDGSCGSLSKSEGAPSSLGTNHTQDRGANGKPSKISMGTGGGTSSMQSTIVTRPAWSWEQRLDGQPSRSIFRRVGDYVLEFLNIRPFLIHKEKDGNLWVWVKEVDGDHLEVVMPSGSNSSVDMQTS